MRKSALLAAVLLAFGSCRMLGPQGPLEETTERLGDIRSGRMKLELTAITRGGARSGFLLEGPFSLPSGASLPSADLAYRQVGPEQSKELSFLSTGRTAYVRIGNQAYELPDDRVAGLRGDEDPGEGGPFDRLEINEWVTEPRSSAGPRIDGVATQVVRGRLEVAAALNNIFDVARELGKPDLPSLEGEEAERLNRAVEHATLELITGTGDRYLRRLTLQVNLATDAPRELGAEIQRLLGVNFRLSLSIDGPNKPVTVSPPRNPLPFSELDPS